VSAETVYLFGKIGDFSVAAALEQDEGKLSGWYFYQSRARQIRLEGKIDRNGALRMDELTGSKNTGLFEGTVKKGRWTGTWRKAPGGASLPFSLEENHDKLNNLNGNYRCETSERVAKHNYTYRWNLKVGVVNGAVKKLDSVQGSYWDNKDEQTCSIDLKELKQVPSPTEPGILLEVKEAKDRGSGEEGGRCTVRIVGNDDILWVRFGDSSEEGNDCRSAGPTMFCSPRAFWNDLVVDRRTQKCKALK
jgi:hypothetical protein